MRPTFKKLQVKDLGNLEHLVAENIEGIEPGLRVIDSRVCLGHAAIDLIAIDSSESLVLVALDFTADEGLLLRGMDAYSWSLEYIDTLRRLYPMANVSSTRPPRILFVVERLTDAFVRRIKQLSFLEIDCLEFRHFEVNGASAVYFDLVARLRRGAPVEPTSTSEGPVATVPVRTPKRLAPEPPVVAPAWSRLADAQRVQPAAATPTSAEPAPLASHRSAIAAAAWGGLGDSGSFETRMVELFGSRSAAEMPTEADATAEKQEAADAEVVDADVVAEKPAAELESTTARQETPHAPSLSARVTASPEWEALLHQLGAAMPAPMRTAQVTGGAAEAPMEAPVETNVAADEQPAPTHQASARLFRVTHGGSELVDPATNETGSRLFQATHGGAGLADPATNETGSRLFQATHGGAELVDPATNDAGSRLFQATHGGAELADPDTNDAGARLFQATHGGAGLADPVMNEQPAAAVEEPVPTAVETAAPTQAQPIWTKSSTGKVVQPITGKTYFFAQAAKATTPAEVPEPKPAAASAPAAAPAPAAVPVAQKTVAPAQRVSAPAQQTTAPPVAPRPVAPTWPPTAAPAQAAAPALQTAAMAATKVDAAKPTGPDSGHPGLEALSFPKDGLSRQWLEFLNQLGGAR
jgi:hypothetical protein